MAGHGSGNRAAACNGEPVPLTKSANQLAASSFSLDGKRLAFIEVNKETNVDLWPLPLSGPQSDDPQAGQSAAFLATPFNESAPVFSPDGRWLAYQSNESGRNEIYVRPFSRPDGKWQVSTGGGDRPVWSRTGNELFYRGGEGIMKASYQTSRDAFQASRAKLVSELPGLEWFDLGIDPQHVAIVETKPQPALRVTLLLNLFDELRRLAPVPGGSDRLSNWFERRSVARRTETVISAMRR